MIIRKIISVLIAFACSNLFAATLPGSFYPTNFEFEDSYQFESKVLNLKFTNKSDHALDVSRVESGRPNVELKYSPSHVESGGTLHITAKILSLDRAGKNTFHFDIYDERSDLPDTRFAVRGFVDWMIDPQSVDVDFGVVQAREGKKLEVPVVSRAGEDARLVEVETSGKYIDADILDNGRKVRFTMRKNLEWGLISDRVTFRTNSKAQPRAQFIISANVQGDVVPSSNPLEIGMVRANKGFDARLTLEGPSGKRLRIGEVSVPGTKISAEIDSCIPKVASCALVHLNLPPQPEKTISIQGVLKIDLPDYGRSLPIPVSVLVVKTDTVVRNLNEDAEKANEAPPSISSIMRVATVAPAEMPRPQGTGPLLTWQVANEWGVYGYEVYRAELENGEFKRVNQSIIKALVSAAPKVGSIYHWRDVSAGAKKEYWYYIQIVYDSGRKQPLSDPQKVRSK